MKIIIAGGGTGGHLYPGIAVAEEFIDRFSNKDKVRKEDITFVGTKRGIESKVIPKEGFNIRYLRAEGIIGKSIFKKFRALSVFLFSIFDALKILREIKPDIVIGVGGYASVATVLVARLEGIPTMILEQNSVPGFANRMLAKFVHIIAISYQESMLFFPKNKTYLTGNPIRKQIIRGDEERAYRLFPLDKEKFKIFIFGGSSGASSINNYVIEALNYLTDLRPNIQFLHQTGQKDYEKIKGIYNKLGFRGFVFPFIYDMADAYKISDIVICRAGASTLSEITALGKPAILIPYPYSAYNHQERNAQKLQEIGAARMIPERELSGEVLAEAIRDLYMDEDLRNKMRRIAAAFGKIDAASKVVDLALSLLKSK